MDIALMIEGQSGLTWPAWQGLAAATEELGFAGLYRSDHFTDPEPPNSAALEAWVSMAWLASHTSRIDFGPMVSPVSFRDPVMMARQAMAIDDLSGGRFQFGVGAGWQEREHAMFGYPLLDVPQRMARFREALEVMSLLLRGDGPASFSGSYYQLRDAELLPRPQRRGGPPIVIGGNGPKYTLPLAARYAQEWNGVYITAERFNTLQTQLDELLAEHGRARGDIRRTLMTGLVYGRNDAELKARLEQRGATAEQLAAQGVVAGTTGAIIEQLGRLQQVGVQRVMLQWFNWHDRGELEAFAAAILPHFAAD
ncbi:TIGR03560 family F420-dependent LLM class oxidoreductase [Chloroflexia bacterium SDU3-3]|nr:TIGR03560 family F420-dependent LLM class oxidoreductase [Chloroflexia bacterium SDU3-3]